MLKFNSRTPRKIPQMAVAIGLSVATLAACEHSNSEELSIPESTTTPTTTRATTTTTTTAIKPTTSTLSPSTTLPDHPEVGFKIKKDGVKEYVGKYIFTHTGEQVPNRPYFYYLRVDDKTPNDEWAFNLSVDCSTNRNGDPYIQMGIFGAIDAEYRDEIMDWPRTIFPEELKLAETNEPYCDTENHLLRSEEGWLEIVSRSFDYAIEFTNHWQNEGGCDEESC